MEFNEYRRQTDIRDAAMLEQLNALEKRVESLSADVRALIDMWQQAKGALLFMKLMVALVAGVAAAITWIASNLQIVPK
jgi:hypothetical protein